MSPGITWWAADMWRAEAVALREASGCSAVDAIHGGMDPSAALAADRGCRCWWQSKHQQRACSNAMSAGLLRWQTDIAVLPAQPDHDPVGQGRICCLSLLRIVSFWCSDLAMKATSPSYSRYRRHVLRTAGFALFAALQHLLAEEGIQCGTEQYRHCGVRQ